MNPQQRLLSFALREVRCRRYSSSPGSIVASENKDAQLPAVEVTACMDEAPDPTPTSS